MKKINKFIIYFNLKIEKIKEKFEKIRNFLFFY